MNPFAPANLSPRPQEPLACDLPYGLSWEDLKTILPGFDEQRRGSAQAFAAHAKQGLNGGDNSCILTLRYPTGANSTGAVTVFIKHNTDPNKAEAQKYQFLASQGVATPRLLAVFQKEQAEVILLEFLPTIGIDFSSVSEANSLLHLVAELNAIAHPPDLFQPTPGLPRAKFDRLVRAALAELANEPPRPPINVERCFAAYQAAQKAARQMPQAVNHNELFFQQVGWAQRGPSRRLVLLDLETLALSPRFTDIAGILYPLAVYTGRDQLDLFHIYLDQLSRLARLSFDFTEAFRELRLLRIQGSCQTLPWLVNAARHPGALELREALSLTANCLAEDLAASGG